MNSEFRLSTQNAAFPPLSFLITLTREAPLDAVLHQTVPFLVWPWKIGVWSWKSKSVVHF